MESTGDDPQRTMPTAEREQRRKALAKRLPGIKISGLNEPSNALVDKMASMVDANVLKYVQWEDCTSRSQEVESDDRRPQEKNWATDGNGYLRVAVGRVDVKSDVSSSLLLRYALTRRGLAAELGGLMSFEVHEKLADFLFEAYLRELPDSRYAHVTFDQLRKADKAIFRDVADRTREGIKLRPDGTRPVDQELPKALETWSVNAMLTPLPRALSTGGHQKRGRDEDDADFEPTGISKRAKQRAGQRTRAAAQAAALAKLQNEVSSLRADRGAAVAAPRGKGAEKGKNRFGPMPKPLIGKARETNDGVPICFNFNMNGCKDAEPGGRCPRGLHVCVEPGCFQAHPLYRHNQGDRSAGSGGRA